MLQELLSRQKEYTKFYFDSLDLANVEKIVDILFKCQGIIFFTGVGKSGLIAKKIAFTMMSTGTRSLYLSPIGAVHGDVGIVSNQDIVIMFSKSGESDELINLVPAIRNKGAALVGVVCNSKSRLAAACHHMIELPFQRELCPFNMAPTTSTTAQIMLGDLMTIALMRHKQFSVDQYALNHPSGRIGKRITLKVKDIMIKGNRIPLCGPQQDLSQVLVELSNKRSGCVLVVDEQQKLLGIFTDGDLRRALQEYGAKVLDTKMQELMTSNPRWIAPHMLAWDAMKIMEADCHKRIMVMPVIDEEKRVLGLLHMHDIIQCGL